MHSLTVTTEKPVLNHVLKKSTYVSKIRHLVEPLMVRMLLLEWNHSGHTDGLLLVVFLLNFVQNRDWISGLENGRTIKSYDRAIKMIEALDTDTVSVIFLSFFFAKERRTSVQYTPVQVEMLSTLMERPRDYRAHTML